MCLMNGCYGYVKGCGNRRGGWLKVRVAGWMDKVVDRWMDGEKDRCM